MKKAKKNNESGKLEGEIKALKFAQTVIGKMAHDMDLLLRRMETERRKNKELIKKKETEFLRLYGYKPEFQSE